MVANLWLINRFARRHRWPSHRQEISALLISCTTDRANIISLKPITRLYGQSVLPYRQIGFNDAQSVASAHTEKNKNLIAPHPRLKRLSVFQSGWINWVATPFKANFCLQQQESNESTAATVASLAWLLDLAPAPLSLSLFCSLSAFIFHVESYYYTSFQKKKKERKVDR